MANLHTYGKLTFASKPCPCCGTVIDGAARFFALMIPEPNSGCWLWLGSLRSGYGRFSLNGKTCEAHRVSYEHLVGPIPQGMMIDHLCRTRCCINPDHLEPVTNAENIRRGQAGKGPGALTTARPSRVALGAGSPTQPN
jgi:hypothetical protein